MRRPSSMVCRRCGLPVRIWGRKAPGGGIQDYWKHSGGGRSRPSCGQYPDPISRVRYESRSAS